MVLLRQISAFVRLNNVSFTRKFSLHEIPNVVGSEIDKNSSNYQVRYCLLKI